MMITPEEALERILSRIVRLPSEIVPLENCAGRVLEADLVAVEDLPPFRNSAMDGFAVRAEDTAGASVEKPVVLDVKAVVRAGMAAEAAVGPGEALKIMTGSAMPSGADAVVMKEQTLLREDGKVRILQGAHAGENVRGQGEDVHAGDPLLRAGARLRPYEIALLASQGMAEVRVVREPRAAFLATGDELVAVTQSLTPGKIRNSNGPAMAGALKRWGVRVRDLGSCRDDPGEIEGAIRSALPGADILLISGGVSVGDFDYTREVLTGLGFREIFWKVALKPGKPLLFGVLPSKNGPGGPDVLVFGLPGNPVSVLVCLEEFVRPALERMQGRSSGHPSYHLRGEVENDYVTPRERRQYLFCQVAEGVHGFRIKIIRPQGSAMVGMACRANALAIAPVGVDRIRPGDVLSFRWLK